MEALRSRSVPKGNPTNEQMYADSEAAWNYLIKRNILPQDILIYGESLGGAEHFRIYQPGNKSYLRAIEKFLIPPNPP